MAIILPIKFWGCHADHIQWNRRYDSASQGRQLARPGTSTASLSHPLGYHLKRNKEMGRGIIFRMDASCWVGVWVVKNASTPQLWFWLLLLRERSSSWTDIVITTMTLYPVILKGCINDTTMNTLRIVKLFALLWGGTTLLENALFDCVVTLNMLW